MKKTFILKAVTCCAAACSLLTGTSYAADNDTATVTMEISAINEIAVSGNPSALLINSASLGSGPQSVNDTTTSYSLTTNETTQKITGSLDSDMPAETTLTIDLLAPSGGVSAGPTIMTSSAQDLVTSIETVNQAGIQISYTFGATSDAGIIASFQRVVTYTLTTEP